MANPNDPALRSWIDIVPESDFPIQNLPFGVFETDERGPRVGVAIGEYVLDLYAVAQFGFFEDLDLGPKMPKIFRRRSLNQFIALGRPAWRAVRQRVSELLRHDNDALRSDEVMHECLVRQSEVRMLRPIKPQNYTDFYSSIEHATNVGMMFRDPANALLPNWRHIPIGYHGRASSIVVSGTDIRRPNGQRKAPDAASPTFGPSQQLDFELEMAFVVGRSTQLGDTVPIQNAEDYIFGMVLFNDWSARDIQSWEYVPLGPFLGKSFGSSVSAWVVTLDALEPFRVAGPVQEPEPLLYLRQLDEHNFDINLEVGIQPEGGLETTVSRSNFGLMYWSMAQQLTHQASNGCNLQVGDLYASGTISGTTPDSLGSMLELAWRGTRPVPLADGSERKFLQDGDTVTMRGYCEKDGLRLGFGEVIGTVLPAPII
ncbi:fumarylacetoacetase [Hymenobacter taeanensis]|uniref:fumarylacetoacetase n=1 Tax=Hymenobacter taeanensis TaxID=2735321 RepID=A0A6M6BLZ0_9BACT|nr:MULTISPECIES: fumarylacetoacetase [Hymenobacter]QJX48463.1 fumarylacetoacetase [Hymenobacter taeanensis]UOQ82042.1 fumarylacetoacetase [Hymenobacter sp. 5414T-23]